MSASELRRGYQGAIRAAMMPAPTGPTPAPKPTTATPDAAPRATHRAGRLSQLARITLGRLGLARD